MIEEGRSAADVVAALRARQGREPDVHGAHLFGLVYPTGRQDVEDLVAEVQGLYLFGNALNPFRFPALAELESDVVEWVARLLHHGGDARNAGAMTSGGTESILMAMLAHRQRARARGVERPVIVAPVSAHPAYAKAAHYFDMDLVALPLDVDWRADLDAADRLVDARTAVVVASAFCYPYGVMDPVAGLAALAAERGAGCHVDACIGGMVLPFLERLRAEGPHPGAACDFDFRVPGVTSISVDLHKYGYVPKGASLVVHRDADWFSHQGFVYDRWGAGLYGSKAMAGARPAAPIACSWAVLSYLGIEGYTAVVRGLEATTARVRGAVAAMGDITPVGEPVGPVLAFTSASLDLHAVADAMEERGWFLNRNTEPPGIHLMLSPAHGAVVDDLLADLERAVALVGQGAVGPSGTEVRYSS